MEPGQEAACRNSSPSRSGNRLQPKGLPKVLLATPGTCPLPLGSPPLPAAHPSLQGGRHTTCKEAGGQEVGRGVRESSWGETSKQKQVRGTEDRSQDQNMLQVEVREGVVFRTRQKYLFPEDF